MEITRKEYNDEPVYYCKSCLSLKVLNYTGIVNAYCGECTSTNIDTTQIEDWERLYYNKYNKFFIKKKSNGEKNY